jgi:hypothetical protein
MESSAGQIAIGADNVNQPVNIASGGQRAVSVGNSNANTAVNLHAGTGNMALSVSSGSFSLDADTGVAIETQTSGSIVIGGDAGVCSNPPTASSSVACSSGWTAATGSIKVGTAGVRTLTFGNTDSSSALRLYAGSGGLVTTVASGTYSLDTTGTIAVESSAGEIQIGTDAVAQAVKIGTAGARDVTIGTSASSTASSLNLHAGTGNMATTVAGGTYSLDTTGNIALESSAGEILIGDDSVNHAIKVGTNGGRVITLGNVESTTAVSINAGSGNMHMAVVGGTYAVDASGGVELETHTSGMITLGHRAGVCSDPATATSQAGCTGSGAVWTPTSGAINIGTGGQRTVTIGNAESSTALRLHSGSGNMDITVTDGTYALDASDGIAMETRTAGEIQIATNAGTCTNPSTATNSAGCTGSWTPSTGAIKVGTGGQRTLTIGNLESSTAVNVNAGSGNFVTAVTDGHIATVVSHSTAASGTYSLDATGNIALESSGGEILIGDDSVNQAIKVGTQGSRTVTVGNTAATVSVKAHTIDATFAAGEFAVQDADLYEMVEVAGSDTDSNAIVSLRADTFLLFDGTTSTAEMPSASDSSLVMKVTAAGGTVLTDSSVAITGSETGGVSIAASHSTGNIDLAASGGASSNVLVSQGNLGINQGTPTYALHIGSTGDDSGAVANSWNTFSDVRLKTNITSIGAGVLEDLLRLRPVTFDWRNTLRHDLGFIAQELRQTFPLLVHETSDGLLSVDYPRLNVYIAQALQEEVAARREAEVSIRRELNELRGELASLKKLLQSSQVLKQR